VAGGGGGGGGGGCVVGAVLFSGTKHIPKRPKLLSVEEQSGWGRISLGGSELFVHGELVRTNSKKLGGEVIPA